MDVHRIHILLSNCNVQEIYSYLLDIDIEKIFDKNKIDEFKKLTYLNQKNDQYSLIIKRILNYYVKYNERKKVIDELFNEFIKEVFSVKDVYLSIDNLKEMQSEGMMIGSHTENHQVLSKLPTKIQKYEVENSFQFIESKIGFLDVKTFCYPYGGFHTFNNQTEEILYNYGCDFSFNVEQPYEIIKSGFNTFILLTFSVRLIFPLFIKIELDLSLVSSQNFLKKIISDFTLSSRCFVLNLLFSC